MDLEELRERWVVARPYYEVFAKHICEVLQNETQRRGIRCEVAYRCKDVASFLKKALRKTTYTDPWQDIRDKAGVRIITPYQSSVHEIETLIHETFAVAHYEDKADALDFDRFGYLGVHFEVSLRGDSPFVDMVSEIQIHTKAQNLWSSISHELAYKSSQNIPPAIQRSIHRLEALMEIFDKEVSADRDAILKMPGREEYAMLDQLEHLYYPLVARAFDKELSLHMLSELKGLYDPVDMSEFGAIIEIFVRDHQPKLAAIYHDYANDDRHFLLFQPESLLIFERTNNEPFLLREKWQEFLPLNLLERMAGIWGVAI